MSLADDAATYHAALLADELALARLQQLRGWTRDAIERLQVGQRIDRRTRIVTFPVRNKQGRIVNLLSYRPDPKTRGDSPKMLAIEGKPRDLFPAPETIPGEELWLFEGEPDVVAGWSLDLPCAGIPGVGKWDRWWPARFAGRDVVMLLDADTAGDSATAKIAPLVARKAARLRIAELADGDLTDMLLALGPERAIARLHELRQGARVVEPFRLHPVAARDFVKAVGPRNPDYDLLGPLLRKGQRVIVGGKTGHGKTTLTLQMISAAAYGEAFLNWHGRRQGSRWLVLALEGDDNSVAQRIEEMGLAERNGNVQIVHIPEGIDVEDDEYREAIERELTVGWDGIVLDPCYRLMQGESKEEANAQRLVNVLDRWRARFGCCIVIPLHTRKGTDGRHRLTVDDLYGSAVFTWNAEVVMGIQRRQENRARLHWWKDRDGNLDVPIDGYWNLAFSRSDYFQITRDETHALALIVAYLASDPGEQFEAAELAEHFGVSRNRMSAYLNEAMALGQVTYEEVGRGKRLWKAIPQLDFKDAA